MLPLDAESGPVEAQASPAPVMPGHLSDLDIADVLVHAIRNVPGILEMGKGLFAQAATYGPGRHIGGIALEHQGEGELAVEVHIVLDERYLNKSLANAASSSDTTPIFLRFTGQVRAVVSQTLGQLGLPLPKMVDVIVDDIR
jgi:hypothetical protein